MNSHFPDGVKRHVNIRRASAEDAPILAKIHVDSWQAAYHGLVPDSFLQGFTFAKREEAFRKALTENSEETYLAKDAEKAVGILTIGSSRDADLDPKLTGEIWGIYLDPAYWRRGVGTLLAKEAERLLKIRGHKVIVLWVLEGNTAARKFYEAIGFVRDGPVKPVELGKPLSAVRYKKPVS